MNKIIYYLFIKTDSVISPHHEASHTLIYMIEFYFFVKTSIQGTLLVHTLMRMLYAQQPNLKTSQKNIQRKIF
jgi:hypothetical protein